MSRSAKAKPLLEILVAAAVAACLVVVGYLAWRALGLSSVLAVPSPVPTGEPMDLWSAYQQALSMARAHAGDARLVSATTQWQGVDEAALLAGASEWSFVFYLSAAGATLDIGVGTGAAHVVRQTRVWDAPALLPEGDWQAGPRDPLLVFLAYEGSAFLERHPEAVVDLYLREDSEGRPTWTVVALDVSDRSLLSLLIDAETGQVLSHASKQPSEQTTS
jgi:hypothetical protein